MATVWPYLFWEMSDKTRVAYQNANRPDRMSDGTVRARQLTRLAPVTLRVRLAPLSADLSQALESYLFDQNRIMDEFIFTYNSRDYTGFIASDTITKRASDGALYWWSFDVIGNSTSAV